jgi:hypothetical protein
MIDVIADLSFVKRGNPSEKWRFTLGQFYIIFSRKVKFGLF